jgi:hypothetical protein
MANLGPPTSRPRFGGAFFMSSVMPFDRKGDRESVRRSRGPERCPKDGLTHGPAGC